VFVEHVLDDGVCLTCGPHELVDGLCETCSDAEPMGEDEHALLTALTELGTVEASRAFDPSKHPRNPAGPGGGRFRSMVDRLKDSIDAHVNGKGGDHPFDGYSREQLRRVAKARGIELKRGEDRDSIAEKLLGHLGPPKAAKKAPAKKALSGRAARASAPLSMVGHQYDDTFSKEEYGGLYRYRGPSYSAINNALRGHVLDEAPPEIRDDIAGMDAAMARSQLPGDVVALRGLSSSQRLFGDRLQRNMTGLEWAEDAFVSTTTSRVWADRFAAVDHAKTHPTSVVMRILVPSGTGAIELSGDTGEGEAELLLQRGLKMRVAKDRGFDDRGVRYLDVEVIG
jgi:hypothetical protein